jgi:uncharacterized protein
VTAAFVFSSCTQQASNGGPAATTADIDDCDRLAASQFDPHSTVEGISIEKIDTAHAIPACAAAVRKYPDNARFLFEYGRALDAAKRYQEAMQWYRRSSDRGGARAQCGLAFLYQHGHGVTQDYAEAIKWYRKAADQGSACGQNGLGLLYANGQGVDQDYAEAVKWFRKAADQGDVIGQNNIGAMYGSGHGVAQDYGEALRRYRIAAGHGVPLAQRNLGASYYLGQGVSQDYAEALKWYQLAAQQGDAEAQNVIGSMYQKGQGVAQDDAEAIKWYHLSAAQGVAIAQGNLAAMYVNGRGVAKNYPEAIKLYLAAANEGDSVSQLGLGAMYYLGEGTKTDYSEAARWFRKSAEQGNADAQAYLGVMYEEGQGVQQDVAEAMKWYASAAKLGNQGAQLKVLELSASRDSGTGTPPIPDAEKRLIAAVDKGRATYAAGATADTDSALVHYNGPVDGGAGAPIHIPAGYVGIVRCSGPGGGTCVLVHSEPMKEPVSCDEPPFGDPSELYAAGKGYGIESSANNMATALKGYSPAMTLVQARAEMRKILAKACEAKYHGGARTDFYSVGVTDHDFDTELVFNLASQYVTMEIAHSAKGREQQAEIDAPLGAAATAAVLPQHYDSAAQDSRPMIYAAFMCSSGGCRAYGESHITGPNSQAMVPFRSLAECQAYIRTATSGGTIGSDGRIKVAPGMWWECRGKHMDSWEAVP